MLNSWENSTEGWSILESAWTSDGFSTSNGVTQGTYSWALTATGVDYGATLQGPSSTSLTALLENAASLSMDVQVGTNGAGFGYGLQIDLRVSQPGGVGTISMDTGNYPGDVGSGDFNQTTVSWTITQAVRTALQNYPHLPCSLILAVGGGGGGTMYIDNLRVTATTPVQGALWVRELWDDLSASELIPTVTAVSNDTSSVGFTSNPWVVNPSETNNCRIMAFRAGFGNDVTAGSLFMGLPSTLDGSSGAMLNENAGFNFQPGAGQPTFWTSGDFMTRALNPNCYIDCRAAGDYWFTFSFSNGTNSLDAQYVTFPASGWGGIGFADGSDTNANFVAVGVTGLNVYFGPTNASFPWGETNATKAVYISQGTLGQPGNLNSTVYNPLLDPAANPPDSPPNYAPPYNSLYTQTNFTGGPYHINAFGQQTVGNVMGDDLVILGHLKTFGDGTAELDAKYYSTVQIGNPWNLVVDTNPATITWDCTNRFSFSGTLTRMLIFQNGQFPFYMFGFRASTNFNEVVGLDPGRIQVSPLTDTFEGYPINLTNLTVEATTESFGTAGAPAGYGTLNYQWYTNGVAVPGATSQNYNIASAALTDAGVYTCVATDPSGTWGSVTNSVTVTVTHLDPPQASVQMLHDGQTFFITYNEPNVTGADDPTHYTFNNGITISNLILINNPNSTQVQLSTVGLPLGTKISLSITGITNAIGETVGTTNISLWTDLVQSGAANWDAWAYTFPITVTASQNDYFNNFVPNNPYPTILQSESLTSWEGPSSGVTILGEDGHAGDDYGSALYGWFVPPVTTNYVFYIAADDGARLSLSTNDSPANLRFIAAESLWAGADEWTNVDDNNPFVPHRGDGTENQTNGSGYFADNSIVEQSPATADEQNRSDQFIVAYWDSTGLTGQPGEPAGANDQANWSASFTIGGSLVTDCILPGSDTNFWPNVDANGQALITLQAGQKYYMRLDHVQFGGGYDMSVTYKMAGQPDPYSGVPGTSSGAASALTGSVIAGTVPFQPTISISSSNGTPVILYTGVLLAGTNLLSITNVVGQSSAATAISLGGPSQYIAPKNSPVTFYRTTE